MRRVAKKPMMVLPKILPAKKSTGRTEDKIISTTREDFSSVTRPPIRPAKVMTEKTTTIAAMRTVATPAIFCSVSSSSSKFT